MKLKKYGIPILILEAVGILVGLLTRSGVEYYAVNVFKPPLTPPGWLFPAVWTVLYALMAVSVVMVWHSPESALRKWALNLFVIQLVLNFFWPLLFFNAMAYGFSVIWILLLWGAVLAMILLMHQVDTKAAWLQVPYLIWLTFAGYLTLGVWLLN